MAATRRKRTGDGVETVMLSTRVPVGLAEGVRKIAFKAKLTRQVVITKALEAALKRPWKGASTRRKLGLTERWRGRRARSG